MRIGPSRLEASIGIDRVCDSVLEGKSLRDIAAEAGAPISTLLLWIASNPDHAARVREARIVAAQMWDEQAEGRS